MAAAGWLRFVRKHLRLWRRFAVQAGVRETHYRVNFLTTFVIGVVQLAVALIPLLAMFEFAKDIRGWSRAETIALAGLYQIVTGLLATVVAPNMLRMTQYIIRGELDTVLMRPVSSQFYVTFRWLNLAELCNVATGSALLVFGLVRAGVQPSPADVVQAVLLVLCGLVLISCVWSAAMYSVFWTQQIWGAAMLFQNILETGRYPVAFFPAVVRAFLIFAVPVAFATTFPIQALSDGIGWWPVAGGACLCGLGIGLLRAYWRFGLRFYASASS